MERRREGERKESEEKRREGRKDMKTFILIQLLMLFHVILFQSIYRNKASP